jgi:hypothetical protein
MPTPDPITTLPDAPSPTDTRAEFSAKSFAFFAALATFITEVNAIVTWIATQVTDIAAYAASALTSKNDAQAAATAASAHANATKWVSGTTYADGDVVWSPVSKLTYRRIGAGAGTTDPSADSVNWFLTDRTPIGALIFVTGDTNAVSFATYVMPSAGAYTVTLPPSPTAGVDWVGFIHPPIAVNGQKVGRNGKKIMDLSEDMDLDMDGTPMRLVFTGDTRGWVRAE